MITLGGIELPDVWFDSELEFGEPGIDARFEVSRNGTPLIWEQSVGFRNADLIGGADTAWISYGTLKQIRALARVAGGEYTLFFEGENYQVRFRNWDAPVISADPLVPRPNHEDTDYFRNIRIKLIIIE